MCWERLARPMSERARKLTFSDESFDLMSDSTGGWYKLIGGLGGQHKALNNPYHGHIHRQKMRQKAKKQCKDRNTSTNQQKPMGDGFIGRMLANARWMWPVD